MAVRFEILGPQPPGTLRVSPGYFRFALLVKRVDLPGKAMTSFDTSVVAAGTVGNNSSDVSFV